MLARVYLLASTQSTLQISVPLRSYVCVCRLAYLHEDVDPKILHGRLRSSCILLDQNWNPKISDFGLVKVFPLEYLSGPNLVGETSVVSSFFHCYKCLCAHLFKGNLLILSEMNPLSQLVHLQKGMIFTALAYFSWS